MPVHKNGDVYDISNYRPISLLPLISKVFEKIVGQKLTDHLETQGLLNTAQHGFRRCRSCETALLRLSSLLFDTRRSKQWLSIVTIDFSKAFDTLNHQVLLDSQAQCHISSSLLNWFTSYLSDRMQQVKYGGTLSDSRSLPSGVLKGSVLGPTMFNVFINSLFRHTPDANTVAYAGDITLHVRSNTHLECIALMQRSMDAVDGWSASHGLSINYAKCFAMLISLCAKKQTDTSAQLRSSSIPICFVRKLKILGVTFSDDLSWHCHSSHIKSRVNGMIKSLQRVSGCLNTVARVQILNAFILPHI